MRGPCTRLEVTDKNQKCGYCVYSDLKSEGGIVCPQKALHSQRYSQQVKVHDMQENSRTINEEKKKKGNEKQ